MYGIVNNAIEDLVRENFGDENWETVLKKSNIGVDYFLNSQSYDDAVTYALAEAVSEVNKIPIGDVFLAFGEWWVLRTSQERYGQLMAEGGSNLKEFLLNLPNFHNRLTLLYPNLTPPEFKVSNVKMHSLYLHYYSNRIGLQEFVRGLIYGLGKLYNVPVNVTLTSGRNEGHNHEIFMINWE